MVEEHDSSPLSPVLTEDPAADDDPHMFPHTGPRFAKICDGLQHKILEVAQDREIGAGMWNANP